MKERILQILKHTGMTATKLADEIGVQRSGISHMISGRNQPSYDFMIKLLKRFPELSAEWLLRGKGQMISSETDVKNQLRLTEVYPEDKNPDIPKAVITNNNPNVTNVTIVKIITLNSDGTFEAYKQAYKE
jgi:transcriptional regulator with XRE-family HTH domain